MGRRQYRKTVLELMQNDDFDHVQAELNRLPVNDVIHGLFSAICRTDDTVHWNGVRAMGKSVALMADRDMEAARLVMRRLLWSLNDESGGIGWGAPEAMAESMVQHEGLAEEYIHMLISYMREDGEELFQDGNFLEHEVLQRGLLWGVGRLAEKRPQLLLDRGVPGDLLLYLHSGDAHVKGLAVRALGLLRVENALAPISELLGDFTPVSLFDGNKVCSLTLDELARQAIDTIQLPREN